MSSTLCLLKVSDTLGMQQQYATVLSHDTILNGFNSNLESCTLGNECKDMTEIVCYSTFNNILHLNFVQ